MQLAGAAVDQQYCIHGFQHSRNGGPSGRKHPRSAKQSISLPRTTFLMRTSLPLCLSLSVIVPWRCRVKLPTELGRNQTSLMHSLLVRVRWDSCGWGFRSVLGGKRVRIKDRPSGRVRNCGCNQKFNPRVRYPRSANQRGITCPAVILIHPSDYGPSMRLKSDWAPDRIRSKHRRLQPSDPIPTFLHHCDILTQ